MSPEEDGLLADLVSSTSPEDELGLAAIERIRNLTHANEGLMTALRRAEGALKAVRTLVAEPWSSDELYYIPRKIVASTARLDQPGEAQP